jgi:hypothetical protein
MPPTLLASSGMNFKHCLARMGLRLSLCGRADDMLAILPFVTFKWKKWL